MANGMNGSLWKALGLLVTVGVLIAAGFRSYGVLAANQAAMCQRLEAVERVKDYSQANSTAIQVLKAELSHVREGLGQIQIEQERLRRGQEEIKDLIREQRP